MTVIRALFISVFLFIAGTAGAATITFDDMPHGQYYGSDVLSTPQGYDFGEYFAPREIRSRTGGSGNELFVQGGYPARMVHSEGLVFSLSQMDVLFFDPADEEYSWGYHSLDVTITGLDASGQVIAEKVLLHEDGLGWRTVVFDSGWSNISTLEFGFSMYGFEIAFGAYDNIVVSAVPVPVPAAAWLLGSALLGLGWMRRRPV